MARIKTKLSKMSGVEQIQLGRTVVTKMTGNSNFTTPAPMLTAITTAADTAETALNAALAARATSKQATTTLHEKLAILVALLLQEAAYVQNITAGNKEKIESSGFDVSSSPGPIGSLPAPLSLTLNLNGDPGTIGLKWKNVKNAASYIVERAADADSLVFQAIGTPTKPKFLATDMTSGSRYWFRVAAVNAAGQGLWTAALSSIAP